MNGASGESALAPEDALAAIGQALFQPLGVEGVYARTARYEHVLERLSERISLEREATAQVLRFPPVMSRSQIERSGYLKSFPNLLGCVSALHGTEDQIRAAADRHESGGEWTEALAPADLVLLPAACYPVYPLLAGEQVPLAGLHFDVVADCFRREPSRALDRLQSFRMREFVRIGSGEQVGAFREEWMRRALGLMRALGLPASMQPASDPFFGRVGQVMAVSQLQNSLKFELMIPYYQGAEPTACMSFNDHREHFGAVWDIGQEQGEPAHSGCVAFGMDRLAVALFCIHGLESARWPASVRKALSL